MRSAWLPASLVVLIALSGCGGSDKAEKPPAPPAKAGGHLTVAEYRAIVAEYRRLRPLQERSDDSGRLAQGRRACRDLRKPDTRLVARVRDDCNNAIVFFLALRKLERAADECTSGSERDRIVCGRARYSRMADAIRDTTNGGTAINAELDRRAIGGLCADSIGMTIYQVAQYRRAEHAARDAVDAISVADAVGFARAQNELADALDAGASGDPLSGIVRACRPPGVKAPKSKPKSPKRSTPKPKPKPLPSVPGEGGVKA